MRALLPVALLLVAGCGAGRWSPAQGAGRSVVPFIEVRDGRFVAGDEPYTFLGVNFWQAMNLASSGPGGDRPRLERELDRLQRLGLRNVRILAGTEGPATAPYRVVPPLQRAPGEYDEALLDGLDYLLAAMRRRGLRAVVCLTNFWFWSGGMAQYLAWAGEGPIPYPDAPGGSWYELEVYTARFYENQQARDAFERHVVFLLERENAYTGVLYREDPTIMAWELANEPRGMANGEAMRRWLDQTAALIKSVDPVHLVTTGSEGDTSAPLYHGVDFVEDHRSPHIDYATMHLWVENWGWYDPTDAEGTYSRAETLALDYLRRHIERARELGKPVVFEEFGLARDRGSHDPATSTVYRDRFFEALLGPLARDASTIGPVRGANLWAWAGEARPRRPPGGPWRPGDPLLGDPPHEPQGWYSLYDGDSTVALIRRLAPIMNGATPETPSE